MTKSQNPRVEHDQLGQGYQSAGTFAGGRDVSAIHNRVSRSTRSSEGAGCLSKL
jgi:hypothetical protein